MMKFYELFFILIVWPSVCSNLTTKIENIALNNEPHEHYERIAKKNYKLINESRIRRSDQSGFGFIDQIRQSIRNSINKIEKLIMDPRQSAPCLKEQMTLGSETYASSTKINLLASIISYSHAQKKTTLPVTHRETRVYSISKHVSPMLSQSKILPLPPFVNDNFGSKHVDLLSLDSKMKIEPLKIGSGIFVLSKLAKKITGSGVSYNGRLKITDGSMCTNNINFDGFVFGTFKCPLDGFDFTAVMCCGQPFVQFCCNPAEAKQYKEQIQQSLDADKTSNTVMDIFNRIKLYFISITVSIFLSILLISCIIGAIVCFYTGKKLI